MKTLVENSKVQKKENFEIVESKYVYSAVSKVNATFGELLQGMLPVNEEFLVTLPINIFSEATFSPIENLKSILVFPTNKQ